MRINIPNLHHLQLEHVAFVVLAVSNFLLFYYLGNDFFWHLEAGEFLYQTGSIPQGDPFSFTQAGKDWVLHEWLYEYFLYIVHSHTGINGVKLFSASISTLALFIVYRSAISLSQNKWLSLVLVAGLYFTFYKFSFPRPQLITYLFLSIYVYTLIGYKYSLYPVRLYWLPILMIVWVNMHGGYIIGVVLLILYIFSELIERWFYDSSDKEESAKLRPVVLITLACIIASLFNPYTYHHWLYPFQVASMTSNVFISEWQSPDFHVSHHKLYLYFVILFFFVSSFRNTKPRFTEIIIPLAFIFLSFISRRHIPVAILVIIPFYALAFDRALSSFKRPFISSVYKRWGITVAEPHHANFSNTNNSYVYMFNWLFLFIVAAGGYSLHKTAEDRFLSFQEDYKPVSAVEFIKKNNIHGNVLAPYDHSGYLLYHLYPNSKVFIDGRLDLYGDKFFNIYKEIVETKKGWQELLDQYPIDYMLLSNRQHLSYRLEETNKFKLVFRNYDYSIYVKNSDKFKSIIERYKNADRYLTK